MENKPKYSMYHMIHPGWKDFFRMYVTETRQDMIDLILNMCKEWNVEPIKNLQDTKALVHPIYEIKDYKAPDSFACLFVNEDDLELSVLSHECVHIAMVHERLIMFGMLYADTIDEDEERMAYYQSSAFAGCVTTLQMNGHFKKGLTA